MYLAQNLKYLREQKGMTQEDMAGLLGNIGQRAVSKWERGTSEPSLDTIVQLAEYFSVTLDDLVLREIAPPKPPIALYVANIKFLRKKHEIKQRDIAKFLGVSEANYCKYENGNIDIGIEKLLKLANFFDATLDELVKQDLSKEGYA